MANVRAFRSGNWSDTDPATSPWGTGGVLYAPAATDDVYSDVWVIDVDIDVNVSSVRNSSTSSITWKDGATTTVTGNGSFIIGDNKTLTANVIGPNTGSTSCVQYGGNFTGYIVGHISAGNSADRIAVYHTGTGSMSISGSVSLAAVIANMRTLVSDSTGNIYINGNITTSGTQNGSAAVAIYNCKNIDIQGNLKTSSGTSAAACYINTQGATISITGDITGGTGGNSPDCLHINGANNTVFITGNITGGTGGNVNSYGVEINTTGTIITTGNITGGSSTKAHGIFLNSSAANLVHTGNVTGGTASDAYGLQSNSKGTVIIIGNVIADSGNAFRSSEDSATNRISGNIINHPGGTAAIYAARFVVDPIPVQGYFEASPTTFYTPDNFGVFSTPPLSAVRSGVSYFGEALVGNCIIPSTSAVTYGVSYDTDGVLTGESFNNPNIIFNTGVSTISAPNSIGVRLKEAATIESTGHLIASFSN